MHARARLVTRVHARELVRCDVDVRLADGRLVRVRMEAIVAGRREPRFIGRTDSEIAETLAAEQA